MQVTKSFLMCVKPVWFWAIAAPLMVMVDVGADLAQPRLVQAIIDKGIGQGNLKVAISSIISMAIVALVGLAAGLGATYSSIRAAQGFGYELRSALFTKVQWLSFGNLDRLEAGSIITRLTNDVTAIQDIVATMLRILVRLPMLLIGSLIMAIVSCRQLAFLYLVIIPLEAITLSYIVSRSQPMFRKMLKGLDSINTTLIENLSGVRVVRAFVRENYELRRFIDLNHSLISTNLKAIRFNGVLQPFMMLSINAGIVVAVWVGGISVVHGSLRIGQLVAFTNYLQQTMMALTLASTFIARLARAKTSVQRVAEIIDEKPEIVPVFRNDHEEEWTSPGELNLNNLSFRYNFANSGDVLSDINLTISPGKTTAILGATGSGKSTLVNLLARFYEATEGKITLESEDIRSIGDERLRKTISVCPQKAILFSGTIRENIAYAKPDSTLDEVIEAAKIAQAHDFIVGFPEGYDTIVGQRGINLSGGQKQRIALARSLLVRSPILILDDATSAVDVSTEARIYDQLIRWFPRQTRIIVAQRINTASLADSIVLIDNGTVIAQGRHDELLKSSSVYQEIYDSQMERGTLAHV